MLRHGANISPRPRNLPFLKDRMKAVAPPKLPINWFKKKADGNMFGNDQYGDCCEVADFRMIQFWGGSITKKLCLHRYSQLTGFVPGNNSSDQGTDTTIDMQSWCSFPIWDGHKSWPVWWAQVDPTDRDQVVRALAKTPVLCSIVLPEKVEQDPEMWKESPGAGKEWEPAAGHRVVLGGWDGEFWTVLTWGMYVKVSQKMMNLFWEGGGIDVVLPHPASEPDEIDLNGIDFDTLTADLEKIKLFA